MKLTVQITVESALGQPDVIQQVARLERGALQPDTLGLTLAEAHSILTGLEQTMVERQSAELVAQEQCCPRCGGVLHVMLYGSSGRDFQDSRSLGDQSIDHGHTGGLPAMRVDAPQEERSPP
jgi:hypothetical protein